MKSKEFIVTSAMLILITYTISLSLVSQAFPEDQTTASFSSVGSIQIQTSTGIGIYSDDQCMIDLTSVTWGVLEPGDIKNVTFYLKNEGDSPIIISLETSNWTPTAATNYLDLSWDYNNDAINSEEIIQVKLTLTIDQNIEGVSDFSFDVTIIGS
jgi:hypothetical protein